MPSAKKDGQIFATLEFSLLMLNTRVREIDDKASSTSMKWMKVQRMKCCSGTSSGNQENIEQCLARDERQLV